MTGVGRGTQRSAVALILSGVFPGLGQFYNRHLIKGAVFLGLGIVLSWYVTRAVPLDPLELLEQGVKLGPALAVLVLLAIWLWSVVDAWRGANR
jgi:hypothetical protein